MADGFSLEFGYLPQRLDCQAGILGIATSCNFDERLASVATAAREEDGWFHPPLVPARLGGRTGPSPEVPATSYALPGTHLLAVEGDVDLMDLAEGAITFLGFMLGLRLNPAGWRHFYRVPTKVGKLTDVFLTPGDIAACLSAYQEFWLGNNTEVRETLFGALHWYLFGQSYIHEFEKFQASYTVLDTLYYLHRITSHGDGPRLRHGERPIHLAEAYGLLVPDWASVDGQGQCELSRLRNDLVHEAKYAGKPIGFAHPKRDKPLDLELRAFCSRLFFAVLGIDCFYIQSTVNSLSRFALDRKSKGKDVGST